MVEPELKFGFRFHRNSLRGKRVVQIMQCFILFFGQNWSGAGAKSFKILEPEPKNFDARSWSLKSEYWRNESGTQRTYWRYNCSVLEKLSREILIYYHVTIAEQ